MKTPGCPGVWDVMVAYERGGRVGPRLFAGFIQLFPTGLEAMGFTEAGLATLRS